MPTYYSLTQTVALANLRVDLSDSNPGAPGGYRWSDATLLRCIDKALERYSWVYPYFQATQLPTVVDCNLYGSPAGSWYVDLVEYPVGRYPKNYPPFRERKSPLIATPNLAATVGISDSGAGGNLSAGVYGYAITYLGPGGGETPAGPTSSITLASSHSTALTLPTGPYGVTGRNIYRTAAGGSQLKLVTTVADNVTGTYADNTPDGSLGTNVPVSNSTANLDMVELMIPPDLYPSDTTTYILELTYASKHVLDPNLGTTVPERHWDALYYGSVAYAMESYLPTVNDNFEYQDGHLRDKVDDTKSTVAWETQCQMAKRDFETRLALIKEESNTGSSVTVHWGDIPIRNERL